MTGQIFMITLSLGWEIYFLLFLLLVSIILYATEALPIELTAILTTIVLLLSGILSTEEAFSGLSNKGLITIAGMLVVSNALYRTGSLTIFADLLAKRARKGYSSLLLSMMVITGVLSAFINNTAVVAIFIPLIIGVSSDINENPSKLLIPLSYSSLFGGVCTLLGTSTNLLVESIYQEQSGESLSLFEFTPIGIVMFAGGFFYLLFFGKKLLPSRLKKEQMDKSYGFGKYVFQIQILEESNAVNKKIKDSDLVDKHDLEIIRIDRGDEKIEKDIGQVEIQSNDILTAKCKLDELKKLIKRDGIVLYTGDKYEKNAEEEEEERILAELLIIPESKYVDRSISESNLEKELKVEALALRDRFEEEHYPVKKTEIVSGDIVLVKTLEKNLSLIKETNDIILVSQHDFPAFEKRKSTVALILFLAAIGLSAFEVLPIHKTIVAAAVLMVVTGTIKMKYFYEAIDWKIILLIAGLIPLGIAIEKTGTSELLSGLITQAFASYGPVVVLAAIYLITTLLTELISNNGVVVVMIPIALSTATTMNIDPKPLIMTIAFAASASFLTPIGYQTNTMVYKEGNYKFSDFLKVGLPLMIIFVVIAIILIPLFFPF